MQAGEERVRQGRLGGKGSQALFCVLTSMAKAFVSPFQPIMLFNVLLSSCISGPYYNFNINSANLNLVRNTTS